MAENFMCGKGGIAIKTADGQKQVRMNGRAVAVEVKGGGRTGRAAANWPAGKRGAGTYQRLNLDAAVEAAWQAGMKAEQFPTDAAKAFAKTFEVYKKFAGTYQAWSDRQRNTGKAEHHLKAELAGASLLARMLAYYEQTGESGADLSVTIGLNKPCDLLAGHAHTAAALLLNQLPCPLTSTEKAALLCPPDANFIARALVTNCCAERVFDYFNRAVAATVADFVPMLRHDMRSCIQPPRGTQAMLRALRGKLNAV